MHEESRTWQLRSRTLVVSLAWIRLVRASCEPRALSLPPRPAFAPLHNTPHLDVCCSALWRRVPAVRCPARCPLGCRGLSGSAPRGACAPSSAWSAAPCTFLRLFVASLARFKRGLDSPACVFPFSRFAGGCLGAPAATPRTLPGARPSVKCAYKMVPSFWALEIRARGPITAQPERGLHAQAPLCHA